VLTFAQPWDHASNHIRISAEDINSICIIPTEQEAVDDFINEQLRQGYTTHQITTALPTFFIPNKIIKQNVHRLPLFNHWTIKMLIRYLSFLQYLIT